MYSYSIHMYTYLYICTTSLRLKKEKFVPWSQRSIAEENVTSTEGFYILPSTKIKFVHGHRILGSLAKPVSGAGNSLLQGFGAFVPVINAESGKQKPTQKTVKIPVTL